MPLPDNRELRELLDEAAPGPWEVEELEQQLADCPPSVGFWVSGEDSRYIASEEVLSEDYDQTERDFTLIALAPQLAEEVIRLREEIDDMADSYRRKRDEVNERMAKHDPRTLNDFTLGKFFTLYTRIIDRLERIKNGGDE